MLWLLSLALGSWPCVDAQSPLGASSLPLVRVVLLPGALAASGRAGRVQSRQFWVPTLPKASFQAVELSSALLPAASEAGGVWEAQDRRGAQGALHSEPHQAGQVSGTTRAPNSAKTIPPELIYLITAWEFH